MEIPKVFREQVIDLFYEAFGEAEVSIIKAGKLYRWSLPRGPYSIGMFITIDSPEYTDIAHIMISDADSHQVEREGGDRPHHRAVEQGPQAAGLARGGAGGVELWVRARSPEGRRKSHHSWNDGLIFRPAARFENEHHEARAVLTYGLPFCAARQTGRRKEKRAAFAARWLEGR
jgi:hypothetical protein